MANEPAMAPSAALESAELALRLAVKEAFGEGWLELPDAPGRARLEGVRERDAANREGLSTSQDLIDFTLTIELTRFIRRNHEAMADVFPSWPLVESMLNLIDAVRNPNQHHRGLAPWERDLISGVAGQLRTLLAKYRSEKDTLNEDYPCIESVKDSFMNEGYPNSVQHTTLMRTLVLGETITFQCSAWDYQQREIRWRLTAPNSAGHWAADWPQDAADKDGGSSAVGADAVLTWTPQRHHAMPWVSIKVMMRNGGEFYRNSYRYDDSREFVYRVRPPGPNTLWNPPERT